MASPSNNPTQLATKESPDVIMRNPEDTHSDPLTMLQPSSLKLKSIARHAYSKMATIEEVLSHFNLSEKQKEWQMKKLSYYSEGWLVGTEFDTIFELIQGKMPDYDIDSHLEVYFTSKTLKYAEKRIYEAVSAIIKLASGNSSDQERKKNANVFETAFGESYINKHNILKKFHRKLVSMVKCRKNNEFEPYASLIQSSGSGKSRLVTELYQEDIYVVYCSFMTNGLAGYPKRSLIANSVKVDPKAYIIAAIEFVKDSYLAGVHPRKFREYISDLNLEETVKNEILRRMKLHKDTYIIYDAVARFMSEMRAKPADYISTEEKHIALRKIFGLSEGEIIKLGNKNEDENEQLYILFAFDEIKELISEEKITDDFYYLRKYLGKIPLNAEIFSLFLDTNSVVFKIHNSIRTTSYKGDSDKNAFFPPIHNLGTYNNDLHEVDNSNIFEIKRLFRIGRPLWSTYCEFMSNTQLLKFAAKKLLYYSAESTVMDKQEASEIRPLVIFGPRLALDILNCELAEKLVSSNMRQLFHTSKNQKLMWTGFSPEPILSLVAANIFNDEQNTAKLVKELADSIKEGNVSQGERGELAARLLLLMAKDKAPKFGTPELDTPESEESFLPLYPVRFGEFLKALLSESAAEIIKGSKLENSVVFFNSFVRRNYTLTAKSLLKHFTMCSAIVCKKSQQSIDLVIPILCLNENGEVELSESNMTYFAISVKNHTAEISKTDFDECAYKKTAAKYTGIRHVVQSYGTLLMAFGENYEEDFHQWKTISEPLYICKHFSSNSKDENPEKVFKRAKLRLRHRLEENVCLRESECDSNTEIQHFAWAALGHSDKTYKFLKGGVKDAVLELIEADFDLSDKEDEDEALSYYYDTGDLEYIEEYQLMHKDKYLP